MEKIEFDTELLAELPAFETFFQRSGFKRIDGSLYGLLVLSDRPLSSEEIESILGVSQSAVSMALKNLSHFNAIDSSDCRERRCKLHTAKENSLSVIASIFRKREQQNIEEFKLTANRILSNPKFSNPDCARSRRLRSITTSCEIAESVINFVIAMGHLGSHVQYGQVLKRLPQALELVTSTAGPVANLTTQFATKIKDGIFRSSGDNHET